MDVIEKWGDDVDSAVNLALKEMKLTREQVDVEVLEEPSRGFFGIGSKLALVRVSKKNDSPDVSVGESDRKKTMDTEEAFVETAVPYDAVPAGKEKNAYESVDGGDNSQEKRKNGGRRRNNTSRNEKPQRRVSKADTSSDSAAVSAENADIAAYDEAPLPELPKDLDYYGTMKDLSIIENHRGLDFLRNVIDQMGLDVTLEARADDKNLLVEIRGNDAGTIIGKRGQTLDAIQYLTALAVNKGEEDYIKVVVDAEDYRHKREVTLVRLATRLADKVSRTRRSVRLEPMNPYERKVIHSTLQPDKRVKTRSEGQDPYRRVVIELDR